MTDMYSNCTAEDLQQQFDDKIRKHLRHYYLDCLGLYDWERRIEDRKREVARSRACLKAVEEISGVSLKDKKMLDVGCGWGGHIIAGVQLGANCTGCDVDRDVLDVAGTRAKLFKVQAEFFQTEAEKLPFADGEFDYVFSVSVLEHVRDVNDAVREMVRVLKPGGVGFVEAPNYFIPVEPHYKILFPPKCPKPLAKVYLKLLARPAEFIDTINYLDYNGIKNTFENFGASITDICKEFAAVSHNYYMKESEQAQKVIKVPVNSYNALAGKLMGRSSVAVKNVFEKYFGIKNIFFLFRKK
ncbi:MAG: class I SAM-dependent methyltransferase [Sedimentisphaerales bacterium]|nr:class I SAM-dependent methyltransferase [Sedimentisphaerales bacterium]